MTLTVRDVCKRYGVTAATVKKWTDAGELIGFSVSRTADSKKRRLRYSEESLARFEALRAATPTLPATRRRKQRQGDVIQFYT